MPFLLPLPPDLSLVKTHASCFICYLLGTEKDNISNLCLRKQRDSPCHLPICPHTCAHKHTQPLGCCSPRTHADGSQLGGHHFPPRFSTDIKLDRHSSVCEFLPKMPPLQHLGFASAGFFLSLMPAGLQPLVGVTSIPLLGWSQGW